MAKPVLKFRLNLPLRGPVMATREGLQSARARLEATRSPRRVSPDTVTAPLTARSEAPPHSPRASTRVNFSAGDARAGKQKPVSGYTGFIPGSQHVAGRSYTRVAARCRKAAKVGPTKLFLGDQIPSSPQSYPRLNPAAHDHRRGHVPGYTGFVPAVRASFAVTYGATTGRVVKPGGIQAKAARKSMNRKSLKVGSEDNMTRTRYFGRGVRLKA